MTLTITSNASAEKLPENVRQSLKLAYKLGCMETAKVFVGKKLSKERIDDNCEKQSNYFLKRLDALSPKKDSKKEEYEDLDESDLAKFHI